MRNPSASYETFLHRLTLNGGCFPGDGYRDLVMLDYTEFIIVAVFTGVLLVFSVVGSVCVFRGHGVRCVLLMADVKKKHFAMEECCFVVTGSDVNEFQKLQRKLSLFNVQIIFSRSTQNESATI